MLFDPNGTGLHWHASVEEEYQEGMPHDRRGNQPPNAAEGSRGSSKGPEPCSCRMGQLLLSGPVSKAYRAVDSHATERLRRWLCKKHKRPGQGTARYPDEHLYDVLGLQRLSVRTCDLPWAKA